MQPELHGARDEPGAPALTSEAGARTECLRLAVQVKERDSERALRLQPRENGEGAFAAEDGKDIKDSKAAGSQYPEASAKVVGVFSGANTGAGPGTKSQLLEFKRSRGTAFSSNDGVWFFGKVWSRGVPVDAYDFDGL